MPFTLYHIGIALFLYSVMTFLDLFALFGGAIIPDIEGILALFIFPQLGLPLHGPFHSFLGAIFLGGVIGMSSFVTWKLIQEKLYTNIDLIRYSFKKSLLSAYIGTFSHITLDSPLYPEMRPFFPLEGNPLFNIVTEDEIYFICIFCFVIGTLILILRYSYQKKVFSGLPDISLKYNILFFLAIIGIGGLMFFLPIGLILLIFPFLILLTVGFRLREQWNHEERISKNKKI
ncbi:MAG: hypothetical protein ACFE9L_13500 [Candidatus Hodarchaeota archaeon]